MSVYFYHDCIWWQASHMTRWQQSAARTSISSRRTTWNRLMTLLRVCILVMLHVWRGGLVIGIGLATERSQVRVPAAPLQVTTLGKLFTHMCLCSSSSINWYRRKLGAKQALHATHYKPRAVDLQLRLVSGWGLLKRRSTPPYGPVWLGKDFSFQHCLLYCSNASHNVIGKIIIDWFIMKKN